jgi:hypothetical protein
MVLYEKHSANTIELYIPSPICCNWCANNQGNIQTKNSDNKQQEGKTKISKLEQQKQEQTSHLKVLETPPT